MKQYTLHPKPGLWRLNAKPESSKCSCAGTARNGCAAGAGLWESPGLGFRSWNGGQGLEHEDCIRSALEPGV